MRPAATCARGSHADLLEQHGKYYQLYTNMIELA